MAATFPKFLPKITKYPKTYEPEILTDKEGNLVGYRKDGKTIKTSKPSPDPSAAMTAYATDPRFVHLREETIPFMQPGSMDDKDMGVTRPGAYEFPKREEFDPATWVAMPGRSQQIGDITVAEPGTQMVRPESGALFKHLPMEQVEEMLEAGVIDERQVAEWQANQTTEVSGDFGAFKLAVQKAIDMGATYESALTVGKLVLVALEADEEIGMLILEQIPGAVWAKQQVGKGLQSYGATIEDMPAFEHWVETRLGALGFKIAGTIIEEHPIITLGELAPVVGIGGSIVGKGFGFGRAATRVGAGRVTAEPLEKLTRKEMKREDKILGQLYTETVAETMRRVTPLYDRLPERVEEALGPMDMLRGAIPTRGLEGPSNRLPANLAKGIPRFNLGEEHRYIPQFEDDVDKALFIVAKALPRSAKDPEYIRWLKELFPGATEGEIRAVGKEVRQHIHKTVMGQPDGIIKIPASNLASKLVDEGVAPSLGRPPITPADAKVAGETTITHPKSGDIIETYGNPDRYGDEITSALQQKYYDIDAGLDPFKGGNIDRYRSRSKYHLKAEQDAIEEGWVIGNLSKKNMDIARKHADKADALAAADNSIPRPGEGTVADKVLPRVPEIDLRAFVAKATTTAPRKKPTGAIKGKGWYADFPGPGVPPVNVAAEVTPELAKLKQLPFQIPDDFIQFIDPASINNTHISFLPNEPNLTANFGNIKLKLAYNKSDNSLWPEWTLEKGTQLPVRDARQMKNFLVAVSVSNPTLPYRTHVVKKKVPVYEKFGFIVEEKFKTGSMIVRPSANVTKAWGAGVVKVTPLAKTARTGPIADNRPGVELVKQLSKSGVIDQDAQILDYGSGLAAAQTKHLKDFGFKNVTPYEPFVPDKTKIMDVLNIGALNNKYDVVMANNVLNIQKTKQDIIAVIKEITGSISKKDGRAIINYPATPRHWKPTLSKAQQETEMRKLIDEATPTGTFEIKKLNKTELTNIGSPNYKGAIWEIKRTARARTPSTEDVLRNVPTDEVSIATSMSNIGTVEAALKGVVSVHADEIDQPVMTIFNKIHGTNYQARNILDEGSLQSLKDSGAQHYHASPVCKEFSLAKSVRQAKANDRDISLAVARNIREVQPFSFTLENVPAYGGYVRSGDTWIKNEDKVGGLYKAIIAELDNGGYTYRELIVNAADYGGAQSRSRLIVQAVKQGELPPVPAKTGPSDWYTLLDDLIKAEIDANRSVKIDKVRGKKGPLLAEIQGIKKFIEESKGRERGKIITDDKPIITMGGQAYRGSPAAVNSGGPATTLTATAQKPRIIIPKAGKANLEDADVITVTGPMMARLMGLPDDLPIPVTPRGAHTIAHQVLGNGVHGAVTRNFIQPLVDLSKGTGQAKRKVTTALQDADAGKGGRKGGRRGGGGRGGDGRRRGGDGRRRGRPAQEPTEDLIQDPVRRSLWRKIVDWAAKVEATVLATKTGRAVFGQPVRIPSPKAAGGPQATYDKFREKFIATIQDIIPLMQEQEVLRTHKRHHQAREILQVQERGIPGHIKQKQALAGQMPRLTKQPSKFTTRDVGMLFKAVQDDVRIKPFEKIDTNDAIWKLAKTHQLPTDSELKLLRNILGPDIIKPLQDARDMGQKTWELIVDATGIPKALKSSIDVSAPMRQGVVFITRTAWWQNLGPMVRSLANPKYADDVDDIVRGGPVTEILANHGDRDALEAMAKARIRQEAELSLTSFGKGKGTMADLTSREEAYTTTLAQRIPIAGIGVRASERAYVTFLNKMRADMFDNFSIKTRRSKLPDNYNQELQTVWAKKTEDLTDADKSLLGLYKEIQDLEKGYARWLNIGSGRAQVKGTNQGALLIMMNRVMWAPRLVLSRFQTAQIMGQALLPQQIAGKQFKMMGRQMGLQPEIRKEVARDLVGFMGVGIATLAFLDLLGWAEIELDPRSPDFAKVKIGKTRYDPWGGFQQVVRYTSQFAMGQSKELGSGKIADKPRLETAGRFLRGKLDPGVPAFTIDLVDGETFMGEELELGTTSGILRDANRRLVPLWPADLVEAIIEDGWIGGVKTMPGITGIGTQTFETAAEYRVGRTQAIEDLLQQMFKRSKTEPEPTRIGQTQPATEPAPSTLENRRKWYRELMREFDAVEQSSLR